MVWKSKKVWSEAFLKLDDNEPIVNVFCELGEGSLPKDLVNGELPLQLKPLEAFICKRYTESGPFSLPALRWDLFRTRNLEGELLPPTRGALLPHLTRVNCVCMRDKSYPSLSPSLPPLTENGWLYEDDEYKRIQNLLLLALKAVVQLTKCGCKVECKGNCSCNKNNLPCTPYVNLPTGNVVIELVMQVSETF